MLQVASAISPNEETKRILLDAAGFDPATLVLKRGGPQFSSCLEVAELWIRVAKLSASATQIEAQLLQRAASYECKPVPELHELLDELKAMGIKIGIASMDTEESVRKLIDSHGLVVDFYCGSDSGCGIKPSGDMVHAFCRAVGVSPNEVAVVGDSPGDMRMARNAGCGLAIGVLTGVGTHDTLKEADVIFESLARIRRAPRCLFSAGGV